MGGSSTVHGRTLRGGSVSWPVRIGDNVHRDAGPWTPAVHALLRHLAWVGFDGAPRVVGMDEAGREVLTFIPGRAGTRPRPPVLLRDIGLAALGTLLRSYHDAVASFVPPPDAVWRIGAVPFRRGDLVRHGDPAVSNTIWRRGCPVALIDWDFAEPGRRETDLAHLAWNAVPLRSDEQWKEDGFSSPPDLRERLHVVCRAYGDISPAVILDELERLHESLRDRALQLGSRGIQPWAMFLARQGPAGTEADLAWLRQRRQSLLGR